MIAALSGGLFLVVVNAGLLYAASAVAVRLLPDVRASVRIAARAVVAIALIVVIAQVLSAAGAYTRSGVIVVVVLLTAALAWRAGRTRASTSDLDDVVSATRGVLQSRGAVLVAIGAVATAISIWRALEYPPLGWDALTYHLVFAARFVQAGRLVPFDGPFAMDHYAHFPRNAEILVSWLLLPFHSDLVAGTLNLWLLAVGWVATYALGRELGLGGADAALGATAVAASPFLFSYITTQNADTLVFAALVTAVLFLTRSLKQLTAADALLTCVAAGIAIGAKYTAVSIGGLVLAILAFATLRDHLRAGAIRTLATWAIVGMATLAALGARQYVLNAAQTGNPIYPLTSAAFGRALPGSPYTDALEKDKGPGNWRMDATQFVRSLNYYPDWRTPTSAGPKFLVLIPLALLAAWRPARWPWLPRVLVAVAAIGVITAYVPQTGLPALSRRFWPGSAPRFLTAPFAILTMVALTWLVRLPPRPASLLRAIVAGFIAWDWLNADTTLAGKPPIAAGAVALLVVLVALWRTPPRLGWRTAAMLAAVGTVLVSPVLDARRLENRWRFFATGVDVHGIPRDFVAGWEYVDRLPGHATIALAAGWSEAGQNYFFYPLMGSHLQHTVTYVPVSSALPGSTEFVNRSHPDFAAWTQQLASRGVTHVFVQAPWPVEKEWMEQRPEMFALENQGPAYRVFRIGM